MIIIDANIILRYLLNDVVELAAESKYILEKNDVNIPNEVIAEVVYVLQKVYKVSRNKISTILNNLLNFGNIELDNKRIILEAFEIYKKSSLDFVDCILCAHKIVNNTDVKTFDKKLLKCLDKQRTF